MFKKLAATALGGCLLVAALCLGLLPVTALATGDHGSHGDGWTELTAGTTTLSGGSYYLSGDVEYTGTESIAVSGEVTLCLNGHKLDLNKQHISVGSGASLTLCDCSTGGVLTGGSGSKGGGVYVAGGGTFTMTGGSIAGNTANAGGGVYVDEGGTFTMEDGSINNNQTTSGGGGGVMVNKGSFTLSGGSITGNTTNSDTFGYGGGVCLYGTFYLSGDPIIQDNTKDNTADNLYLGWQTINIAGPLGESAHIGVNAENAPRSFISGWSDNMAGEDPSDYFSSDGDSWSIGLNTAGDAVLGSQCTTITLNSNGGTLPEYSLVEGAALPIPTKTGYTFAGWYENPGFGGSPVTDVPTGSTVGLTFYAKWTPNAYTVTFDANGGSVSQTSAVTVAGKLTSLPTPAYDGYDFLGWFTDKEGGDKVTTDTVFTADSVIYAHWQNIPVTSLELDKDSLTLRENGSDTLTATVEPADATNKAVTWESSDTDIATVSEDGTVTAVSAGRATITATAADGSGASASCEVTVTHGDMVQTPKKDATCTAYGTEGYWTCGICGKHYKDEDGTVPTTPEESVIPATGHDYGEPAWSWSEDGKTATATFTCKNDGSHQATEDAAVTSAVKTSATCTEAGVTTYTATVEFDGETYTSTKDVADIPAAGHKLTKTEAEAPACTEPGSAEYWTCGVCGKAFSDAAGEHEITPEDAAIPATGHEFEGGLCSVCGARDASFSPALVSGDGAKWTKGSSKGLTFVSSAAFADLVEVRLDGRVLSASEYVVREGSTVVTLPAKLLEGLKAGDHELLIVSGSGTVRASLTVAEAARVEEAPKAEKASVDELPASGDSSAPALAIASAAAAGAGLVLLSRRRAAR